MQVGAVLRAEKIARSAARLRKFSVRKWANSLQIRCAVDAQRTKTSAGVAAKTFWRLRISASSFWRVQCRKRTRPTSNMRKILPKFASLTHEIVADFSRCRHAAHRTLRFLLQRFRCETRKTSAQLQCKSAPCCAPKKSLAQRRDCVNFPIENGRNRCNFSARSTRSAPKLRPASLRKHSDVSEFMRRVAGACNAANARIQRSNLRKILLKFA